MKIEALHDFHNEQYAEEWAKKFTPTPERLRLFKTLTENLPTESEGLVVLELGVGPGYLADHLLFYASIDQYLAVDFASAMLAITSRRTQHHNTNMHLIQGDLINEDWAAKIPVIPNAIVTTWTLHDLFSSNNILEVYKSCYQLLPAGGVLLNGDFVKPTGSTLEYEGGRIEPSQHLNLLKQAGFDNPEILAEFETSLDQPTTTNNYMCFKAVK